MTHDELIDSFWKATDQNIHDGAMAFAKIVAYCEELLFGNKEGALRMAEDLVTINWNNKGQAVNLLETLPEDLIQRGTDAILIGQALALK